MDGELLAVGQLAGREKKTRKQQLIVNMIKEKRKEKREKKKEEERRIYIVGREVNCQLFANWSTLPIDTGILKAER